MVDTVIKCYFFRKIDVNLESYPGPGYLYWVLETFVDNRDLLGQGLVRKNPFQVLGSSCKDISKSFPNPWSRLLKKLLSTSHNSTFYQKSSWEIAIIFILSIRSIRLHSDVPAEAILSFEVWLSSVLKYCSNVIRSYTDLHTFWGKLSNTLMKLTHKYFEILWYFIRSEHPFGCYLWLC